MRTLIRGYIALAMSALMLAVAAGPAGAVNFGWSEPTGACTAWGPTFCTQWATGIGNLTTNSAFTTLVKHLPVRYVRLNAAYNLLSDYNASTDRCQASGPYTKGGDDGHGFRPTAYGWNILRSELQVARTEGLTPLITIVDGFQIPKPANARDPIWPIPMYWDGHHYKLTTAGQSYRCGVQALIEAVDNEQRAGHGRTADWETFNEPDARKSYNGTLTGACNSSSSQCRDRYTTLCAPVVKNQCGPLEAANLYVELSRDVKAAHAGGKVAALAVTRPGTYAYGYLQELVNYLRVRPGVLSYHDYIDPTSNGADLSHGFSMYLQKTYGGKFEIWITESGIYLSEFAKLPATGGSNEAHGCQYGTNHMRGLTGLGRCIDGNAKAQATGATDFKSHLATNGSYKNVKITELFWYEFRALPPSPTGRVQWDSGLVDANNVPRSSYCVLTGTTGCKGNPNRNK
jgi:hypothetical protein